jgi:hypothetical protein
MKKTLRKRRYFKVAISWESLPFFELKVLCIKYSSHDICNKTYSQDQCRIQNLLNSVSWKFIFINLIMNKTFINQKYILEAYGLRLNCVSKISSLNYFCATTECIDFNIFQTGHLTILHLHLDSKWKARSWKNKLKDIVYA